MGQLFASGSFGMFFCCWFFSKRLLWKNYFRNTIECQTVWIQIRTKGLSVLIWVQTVCKGNHNFSRSEDTPRQTVKLAKYLNIKGFLDKSLKINLSWNELKKGAQWLSGSAWLETERPRVRASPGSLRCGPWARHIYPSLVLVQPRKTCPCLTEILLMGLKESNKTNKKQMNWKITVRPWKVLKIYYFAGFWYC